MTNAAWDNHMARRGFAGRVVVGDNFPALCRTATVEDSPLGGLRATVRLPLAQRASEEPPPGVGFGRVSSGKHAS